MVSARENARGAAAGRCVLVVSRPIADATHLGSESRRQDLEPVRGEGRGVFTQDSCAVEV
jgi:hypothetical protein